MLDLGCETTGIIDRTINIKPIKLPDMEIVSAVPGSSVDAAGAGFFS